MSGTIAVFFDIGDTLASPIVSPAGELTGLQAYPFVGEVLARLATLRSDGDEDGDLPRLGLMSNTAGQTATGMRSLLDDAGLLAPFDDELLLFSSVEGVDKSQPAFFVRGRERAGLLGARCLFVGEHADERKVAGLAGFVVSPHPLHALHLVEDQFGFGLR